MKFEATVNYRISLSDTRFWSQLTRLLLSFEDLLPSSRARVNDQRESVPFTEAELGRIHALWTSDVTDDIGYRTGEIVFESRNRDRHLFMMWSKQNPARAARHARERGIRVKNPVNAIVLQYDLDFLKPPEKRDHYLRFFEALVTFEDAIYGDCFAEGAPRRLYEPRSLDDFGLPDPGWLLFLGAPYVALIGRERILSAPCSAIHELRNGGILMRISEDILDGASAGRKVRSHLGSKFFDRGLFRRARILPDIDYSKTFYS
jgi:hypothetical protein